MKKQTRYSRSPLGMSLLGLLTILAIATAITSKPAKEDFSGLASVSGTVNSSKPFQAAKVYFRNAEKHRLYMVYTVGGKYQAMFLTPGTYELTVTAKGLTSDPQNIEVTAGQKATANATLHDEAANDQNKVELVTYDQIYPAGPGQKIAERLCIRCHGPNFLPGKQWTADQWNSAIDYMEGNGSQGVEIQPGDLNKDDREVIVSFLTQNFGPTSKKRGVKFQVEMPVDEAKLGKAEIIEYYLAPDPPNAGTNSPEYANMRTGPWGKRRVSQDIVFDAQGDVWVTDRNTPNRICRIDPRTGEEKDFETPTPTKGIHDMMMDKDGMIWVPETSAENVNVFDTKTLKWVAKYPMDPDHVITAKKEAQAIVIDSKHNVYMNFIVGNGMTRLDAESKKETVSSLPTPDSFPYGVVKDSKDNIYIAEFHGSKIARIDASTQKYTEFPSLTHPAAIRRLTVDSKDNVWFGLFSAGKLEKLDPKTGKVIEWNIPFENSEPYDEKMSGNKVWISDAGQGGALLLFDQASKSFTVFPTPQVSDMPMIRVTNDGAVWYAPRSGQHAGAGVLYPDMTKVSTLAGYGNND